MKRICVYCGSSRGARPEYAQAARRLGALLAERGVGVVYGGARVGTMGEVANAALEAGGEVLGVIPRQLVELEVAHGEVTELRMVETMHERKALMESMSDGFITLPGAFGSHDELFEVLTWSQLGIHSKPVGLINVLGYYDDLLRHLDKVVREGFLRPENRERLLVAATPEQLLDRFGVRGAP